VLSKPRSYRPSHATVVAYLALFVALGGSSYAALRVTSRNVPKDALTGADIKNLTGKDVHNNSLTGADVKNLGSGDVANGRLLAEDFAPGQLPAGPPGPPGRDGVNGAANVTYRRAVLGPISQQSNYTKGGARCQAGERLIGGGAGWSFAGGSTGYHEYDVLSVSGPGVSLNATDTLARPPTEGETPNVWYAAGQHLEANPGNLVVYAICASP
jgi:hypothetical protein